MHSESKVPLDPDRIAALTRVNLGVGAAAVVELTEGMYNAAYRLDLDDGTAVVLKVAPPDSQPSLRYEHALMRTEADFYARARGLAPVPDVLATDFSRRTVDRDVLFVSVLEGGSLRSAGRRLSRGERRAVRAQLGGIVGRLHGVVGDRFGYERPDGGLSASSWAEAFAAMVDAVLADIRDHRTQLGIDADDVRDALDRGKGALEVVEAPALVHFDLWDGNVFVTTSDEGVRVSGIIDGERAFWGDPLADLVSTSLLRDPARDRDFNRAYAVATGADLVFDTGVRTRLSLYSAYLCLLMLAEAAPRGYRGLGAAAMAAFVRRRLKADVRRLRT